MFQHERGIRRPGSSRKSSANTKPSKTLFVINFDTHHTRTRDLERHFEPYGKIVSVRIRRNFAFVQYESQDDATRALDTTNMRYNLVFCEVVFKAEPSVGGPWAPLRVVKGWVEMC